MGQWKSRVNVNVNSRLRIRRALNSTSGWTRVGGVALCKLLTTYLVCRAFYNPGEPLHIYIHARACTCRSQIRPVVSLVQEGGNFMIAAHPITSLALSPASLSLSFSLAQHSIFHLFLSRTPPGKIAYVVLFLRLLWVFCSRTVSLHTS